MATLEFNFDGLVGPTHNYAGLSHGNVASKKYQHSVSSPKRAALQGLQKMKFVRELGIEQCVLPPLLRPKLDFLRNIGFSGNDQQVIAQAANTAPVLLAICYSASNMWTANAATVSPSADTTDARLHLTPANLTTNLHRSLEATDTTRILRSIFSDSQHFDVHDPLPGTAALSDEGAANHTRLCGDIGQPGIEMFVYGTNHLDQSKPRPVRFPARQTRESVAALARRHLLHEDHFLLIQQNPKAIDAGVFHNDVISVGHENVLICHEWAFSEQSETLDKIKDKFYSICEQELFVVELSDQELPIEDAIRSYLFNSQILTCPDGSMTLVCPTDCEQNTNAKACTDKIIESANPITSVHFLDLRQSMNNGGGPACLRLRVQMNEIQQAAFHQPVRLSDELYLQLTNWVEQFYRDEISPDDLRDPKLMIEAKDASHALSGILGLPISGEG